MRLVLAVSALLATTLVGGTAVAQGYCDDCRSRDKPNRVEMIRERMANSAPREQIPDRRPQTERPRVLKDRPEDVAKERSMNPKSAQKTLQVRASPSDREVRAVKPAAPPAARDMVLAHTAKNGGPHGGRVDTDLINHGVPKQAKTAGLKLKVLEIVRPANARPQISPAGQLPGCSAGGHCIAGDGYDPAPSIDQENERYTPKLVEKALGEKDKLSQPNLSTVKPNQGPVMAPAAAHKQQPSVSAAPPKSGTQTVTHARPEVVRRAEIADK